MFTFDTIIDGVQTAKKQAVKSFVKHDEIANQLNSFVDAQTAYTKDAVKVGTEAAARIGEEVIKVTREAADKMANGDYVKKYADKVSQDFYQSFWQEAFRWYNQQLYNPTPAAKAGKDA
jgi:hypothetical protein